MFSIAVFAWNLAIVPKNERQKMMTQLLLKQGLGGNDVLAQQDIKEIVDELIVRKQKLFPNNKRFIIEFQLQDSGDKFHLSVASTLGNQTASGRDLNK